MGTNRENDIYDFWNNSHVLGDAACTRDMVAKRLEIDAIMKYAKDGMRILDAGCGNGIAATEIAEKFNAEVVGFDFSSNLVEAAKERAAGKELKGSVKFMKGDVKNPSSDLGSFDLIYTERVIINLPDWPSQQKAISGLVSMLKDDGLYVMCENSMDGLSSINEMRKELGMDSISPPWHNRYLQDHEIMRDGIENAKLVDVKYFSSTYYFLSRVVNACLAAQEGVEPDYDAAINKLALKLPAIGNMGQARIWLWHKDSKRSA